MKSTSSSICFYFVLFVLSVCVHKAHLTPTTSTPKIVIIGAGPAGISAAVKLLDYGFEDVTILEAQSRVGGRIHTIPFADNVIDMGAQWCHGEKNNVVYELMKDKNIFGSSMPMYDNISFVRSNGEIVPNDVVEPFANIYDEVSSKRKNKSIPFSISIHDFLVDEFNVALKQPEFQNINKKIIKELLTSHENYECTLESSDNATVLPVHTIFEYEECEGDQSLTWKDRGFRTLLNLLMKTEEIGKEYGVLHDHIRLLKKVKGINWKRDDNKVMITTEDGLEILADHVIVTISLGVLKAKHATLFDPALPDRKQEAIKKIEFGTVSKIFLELEKKFWPDYWTGFTMLWIDEDLEHIRDTDKFWWEGVVGFYTVDYQPRVLEVWLIGPSARHMETLSEDHVKETCVKLLQRFLKWDIPQPINITKTDWYKNSNFKGTYSYQSIETVKSGVSALDLEKVLSASVAECVKKSGDIESHCEKPIVQFAGEATNMLHYSTVHGAVETGWREAKRLADFYDVYK